MAQVRHSIEYSSGTWDEIWQAIDVTVTAGKIL